MVELQLPKLMMGVRFSSPAQNRRSERYWWTGHAPTSTKPPQNFSNVSIWWQKISTKNFFLSTFGTRPVTSSNECATFVTIISPELIPCFLNAFPFRILFNRKRLFVFQFKWWLIFVSGVALFKNRNPKSNNSDISVGSIGVWTVSVLSHAPLRQSNQREMTCRT